MVVVWECAVTVVAGTVKVEVVVVTGTGKIGIGLSSVVVKKGMAVAVGSETGANRLNKTVGTMMVLERSSGGMSVEKGQYVYVTVPVTVG